MDAAWLSENIPAITPTALLLFAVLMIMRGTLVPRTVVEDRIKDRDRIIDEQAAHIKALEETNAALRIGNQTTLHVLDSLPEVAGVRREA
jgi:hypothetical protein